MRYGGAECLFGGLEGIFARKTGIFMWPNLLLIFFLNNLRCFHTALYTLEV